MAALGTAALVSTSPPARAAVGESQIRADVRSVVQQRIADAVHGLDTSSSPPGGHPAAGRDTRLVGSLNLPGGLNGDVYAYQGFAYVGTWSGPCPGTGVKIIDVRDPAHPRQVATAGGYPNTSAEDMQVVTVRTSSFSGDLLGIGLQDCGLPNQPPGLAGLDLWDVTDPVHPARLGFFDVGGYSGGVHEVSLTTRTIGGVARLYALAAVPFAEVISTAFTSTPRGDFHLIDATNPTTPVLADDWGAGKDGGLPYGSPLVGLPAPFDCTPPPGAPALCRGHSPVVYDHSASPSADGRTAYLAYWDAGAILLDMTDPTNLRFIGRTVYPAGSEGDTHSSVPNASGSLLVTTDEDFSPSETIAAGLPKEPGDTWGFARIWSLANPANPVRVADVATPHSLTNKTDGFYSVHNPQVVGDWLYLSWYSDGLRVYDIANPAKPREVAFYRPQPTLDPTGVFAEFGAGTHPIPFVWGVHVTGGLTYLSDINYGLYVVRVD